MRVHNRKSSHRAVALCQICSSVQCLVNVKAKLVLLPESHYYIFPLLKCNLKSVCMGGSPEHVAQQYRKRFKWLLCTRNKGKQWGNFLIQSPFGFLKKLVSILQILAGDSKFKSTTICIMLLRRNITFIALPKFNTYRKYINISLAMM